MVPPTYGGLCRPFWIVSVSFSALKPVKGLCLGRVRFNEGAAGSKSARAVWGLGVKCLECQSKQLGS